MINLIKRDLKIIYCTSAILFILASVPLTQLIIGSVETTINLILLIVLAHTITTYSFGYDAKNSSHILFRSLPVKPWEIVISKYVLLMINFIIVGGYIFIVTILINYLKLAEYNLDNMNLEVIIYTVMAILISFSVSLPLIFFSNSKIGDMIGRIAMFVTVIRVSNSLYIESELNAKLIDTFNSTRFISFVLAGFLLSIILSIYIIRQKEYRE